MKKFRFLMAAVLLAVTLVVFSSCVAMPNTVVKEQVVNISESRGIYFVECTSGTIYQTRLGGIEDGGVYYFAVLPEDNWIRRYSPEFPESK